MSGRATILCLAVTAGLFAAAGAAFFAAWALEPLVTR